jgi:putative effector of murein hydrolase LrgA (UPF0299 family)
VYVPSPATVNVFDAYCSRSKSTVATPIVPSASVSFVVTFIVTGVSSSVLQNRLRPLVVVTNWNGVNIADLHLLLLYCL